MTSLKALESPRLRASCLHGSNVKELRKADQGRRAGRDRESPKKSRLCRRRPDVHALTLFWQRTVFGRFAQSEQLAVLGADLQTQFYAVVHKYSLRGNVLPLLEKTSGGQRSKFH